MELGKYKLAMRPKKYLTREFVVYKAAPEAMDDVITEEQNIIDTMPSQAPVMDNYMPEFPGMEDPSLRQIALAEGGTPAGKKTEKITRVGKPVYETSEGEMVSEQSRTLKLGNLYYNVPSIHDGKKYTDEQLVELLNKNLISPISVHSSLEGALDESKFRSSTLFDTEEDYGQQLSAREGSFADGGVVQREGFKDGINYTRNPTGKNQYKTKTLKEIIQIKKSYPDNFRPKDFIGEGTLNNVKKKIGPAVRLLTKDDIKNAKKAGVMFPTGKRSDPEKERARDRTRREYTKTRSSPAMEKELRGTKEINLSHAGRKNTPVNLGNLMYTDAVANIKMLYPFEKPLDEAMTKFEKVYNSDASPEVKRKAAFELQKFDRELRKKYPEYAKLKTRFQFKNSAFEPGFVFKEKLPNPSLAISNEPGTSLKGINPKSKKGEALIKIGKEKLETIIENIGCPTGTLEGNNGANCYVKGAEKIQAGKLNQNEFNILQKAVKSPVVANAIKYGGTALKGLGAALTPLIVYDTYSAYKEGKPISEALEYGLLGTNIIGGTRDEMKLTPQEREARGVQQQYEREQQDVSGLSSDFYIPSNLSVDQAAKIYKQGQDRVAAERAAEEKQVAGERVYEGDPGILDYSEYAYGGRVGLEKGGDPKDKPIVPINPMMDEGPQDPSRRTFIQGAGGVGLAGLLLGTGLLKLGKSVAVPSKIGSMIKNTTAPSWMEALITKVIKEGTDIPIPKQPGATAEKISIKELEFKNPENGKTEIIRLKIDEAKDTIDVDYIGDNTLAGQGVNFKISPKEKIVKKGEYLTSEKVKNEYQFSAHEAEPRVVNWDGDIEFDGETGVRKIIDLNSDISGLKSFVTGGKGVDKKVAKIKRETVDKIEKNPAEYIEDVFDDSYYDPSLPTE